MDFQILPQRQQDAAHFEALLDRTFGTDRLAKTVYRLREGVAEVRGLRFVAVDPGDRLLASLRFWPIMAGSSAAILLGPLAVEPALQGRGVGKALVRHGLDEARRLGHRICVVVGEPEYYGPYGFTNAGAAGLELPGPVDPRRFQLLELKPGALEGVGGLICRAGGAAQPDGALGGIAS